MAITPAMFISDIRELGVPDLDQLNKGHFAKRIRYRQRLKEEIRSRFRLQYLGQLSRQAKHKNTSTQVTVGDVVLVGNDIQKRLDWPLAVIKEVFPGKDGHNRVVKLKTGRGDLIRPVQRLIPLEVRQDVRESEKFVRANQSRPKTHEKQKSVPEELSEPVPEEETTSSEETSFKTRSGRLVKKPKRFEA